MYFNKIESKVVRLIKSEDLEEALNKLEEWCVISVVYENPYYTIVAQRPKEFDSIGWPRKMIDEDLKLKLKDKVFQDEVLKEIEKNLGTVVRPVQEYCDALETWAEIQAQKDEKFAQTYMHLQLSIRKSCLLDRLIYCREPLREIPCPKHRGHWSGIPFEKNACECQGPCGCLTGWIK